MRTRLGLAAVLPLIAWVPPLALAQDSPPSSLPPPLTIAYVEGRADIARIDGVTAAQAPDILEDGDRFITGEGRAELVYADGSLVHVDRGSDLRIDRERLGIVRGRIVVRTSAVAEPLDVTTPVGMVRLEPRGEYQITARDLDGVSVVAAIAGRATLALASSDVLIAAGDEVLVDPRGLEPRWSRAGARRDGFSDWASRRVSDMAYAQRSQPLPVELTAYAPTFASYGSWDTLPTYGPVWFPRVAAGWRPYGHGSWRHTRYGWTWIDLHPWGWPVHHYGRWGHHPSRGWYWMPRRAWGPAWVGWAVEANYIGWAPLGWNSRPVVDFFVGARVGPFGVWAGSWSVVPRRVFGGHGPVGRHFADVRRLPGPVLGGFVVQGHAPRGPGGWERRVARAPGYGRPTPAPRLPGDLNGRPGREGQPGRRAVSRDGWRSPGTLRASRPAGGGPAPAPETAPVSRRDPRTWPTPRPRDAAVVPETQPRRPPVGTALARRADAAGAPRMEPRQINRRPTEPRPMDARPLDSSRRRDGATATARGGGDRSPWRPTASPSSGLGRPVASPAARSRGDGNARGQENTRSGVGRSSTAGASRGGEAGNRRRPR